MLFYWTLRQIQIAGGSYFTDCQYWQPCLHGAGSDCSKGNQEACCLESFLTPTDPCQKDCKEYKPPPNALGWAIGCAAVVLLTALALCVVRK
eukprot:s7603_g1.t1